MTIFKKITAVFVGIIISFTVAFGGAFSSNAIRTSAEDIETTANFFDNTSVDEDLKGKDLSSYVVNENKSPEIVRVDEYCFAHSLLNCENYGLYLYVYNPFDVSISERTGANIVNIAVSYKKNEAGEYKATKYDNLPLKYCNVSESGRIIKFRVQDEGNVLLSNAREQNSDIGERRYDIAGVQLWELGASGAMEKDWRIATTYYFSGYAKGYGADENEESTLTVKYGKMETLQLKPQFTNYRMSSEYDSKNHLRYEVNSSYFVIPERYINDYGKLQKIHAQWYEYKTSPIFTTNDDSVDLDAYNGHYLRAWIGVDIGKYNENVGWSIYNEFKLDSSVSGGKIYDIGYNTGNITNNSITKMAYLFCDRWTENYQDVVIAKEDLEYWIKNYCENYNRPADIALNGAPEYSSDLFAESIEDYRLKLLKENEGKAQSEWTATRGLVEVNVDADQERETLLSYADTHNDWDNFWADFFGNDIFTNSSYSYAPIQPITMEDLNLSKTEFCDKFLVNSQDYQTFYNTCYEALKENSDNPGTPYVFRYAQTDYLSVDVKFDQKNLIDVVDWFPSGYMAQETVFLNFDYIDFTFRSEKKGDTVIPVVMDPVDVINAVTYGGTQEKDPANWLPYAIVITLVCVATLAVTIFAKKELRR